MDRIHDPVLDRFMDTIRFPAERGLAPWTLVRVPDAFPPAWIAREAREAPSWQAMFVVLSFENARRPSLVRAWRSPSLLSRVTARSANVKSWDGNTAIVEHDGPCILILRRAFYPGWVCQVDGGPRSTGTESQRWTAGRSLGRRRDQSHRLSATAPPVYASDCHLNRCACGRNHRPCRVRHNWSLFSLSEVSETANCDIGRKC